MLQLLQQYRAYAGTGLIVAFFLCALAFLCFAVRDTKRTLVVYGSAVFLFFAFFAPFNALYTKVVGDDTYRRILWLLPVSITIAFAYTELVKKEQKMLLLLIVLLVFGGVNVYREDLGKTVTKAENSYNLPQDVVDVCDYMLTVSDRKGRDVWVAVPVDFVEYVRQYTSRIGLFYGREMLDSGWNVGNELYDAMSQVCVPLYVVDHYACDYVIITKDQCFNEPAENSGYVLEAIVDDYYLIYRNTLFDFQTAAGDM